MGVEESYCYCNYGDVENGYDEPGENHSVWEVSAGVFYLFGDAGDFCQASETNEYESGGCEDS